MGRLSAQMQLYIAVGLIAVITIAVAVLVIMPLFEEASSLDGQIATEETNLAEAQALVARRQSAKAQSAANEVELMRIANQIPDSPLLPSVIIEIQDVANAADVDLDALSPSALVVAEAGPDGVVPNYHKLSLALTLRGAWAEVIDFSRRLDALDRGVRITSSTFTAVPETEEEDAYVNANITLEVYVMGAAAGASASEAAGQTPATTTP